MSMESGRFHKLLLVDISAYIENPARNDKPRQMLVRNESAGAPRNIRQLARDLAKNSTKNLVTNETTSTVNTTTTLPSTIGNGFENEYNSSRLLLIIVFTMGFLFVFSILLLLWCRRRKRKLPQKQLELVKNVVKNKEQALNKSATTQFGKKNFGVESKPQPISPSFNKSTHKVDNKASLSMKQKPLSLSAAVSKKKQSKSHSGHKPQQNYHEHRVHRSLESIPEECSLKIRKLSQRDYSKVFIRRGTGSVWHESSLETSSPCSSEFSFEIETSAGETFSIGNDQNV